MFHLTPTHTVFNLYSSHTVFNCTTTNSILRFSKNSRRYTSQDSSFLRTSQYSHYWENMRQRRSFSFPSSHYCTNFSLYLKKSLFHAGAFVSDGILAASSRVALAKVDLRSRELINRSVLPHKHLDGLRSVLFVHPMPDFFDPFPIQCSCNCALLASFQALTSKYANSLRFLTS